VPRTTIAAEGLNGSPTTPKHVERCIAANINPTRPSTLSATWGRRSSSVVVVDQILSSCGDAEWSTADLLTKRRREADLDSVAELRNR
jgi:hypothetical protein